MGNLGFALTIVFLVLNVVFFIWFLSHGNPMMIVSVIGMVSGVYAVLSYLENR